MTVPRVDVGIVSWNTRDLTLQAIEQLLSASRDVDLTVLLRDNGSADGTADAVRERFPQVLLERGDNVGFAAGVNTLLERSDAPWFLTLNSDAWPEPGAVKALVDVAEAHPRAAVVAPRLLRPDGALEPSAYALPSLRLAAVTGLGLSGLVPSGQAEALCLPSRWAHDREREVGWAVGAALLLRRAAVEQIGPFDERFFMYAEDLDWCWRAREAGWQVVFTPAAVVRHVGNASGQRKFGAAREQVAARNAAVVVRRRLGRRAAAWQLLNAVGALRVAALAALRGDRGRARFWARQVPAHLSRKAG